MLPSLPDCWKAQPGASRSPPIRACPPARSYLKLLADPWIWAWKPSSGRSSGALPIFIPTDMSQTLDFSPYFRVVNSSDPFLAVGAVSELVGLLIESTGPAAALGDFCEIQTSQGRA